VHHHSHLAKLTGRSLLASGGPSARRRPSVISASDSVKVKATRRGLFFAVATVERPRDVPPVRKGREAVFCVV